MVRTERVAQAQDQTGDSENRETGPYSHAGHSDFINHVVFSPLLYISLYKS